MAQIGEIQNKAAITLAECFLDRVPESTLKQSSEAQRYRKQRDDLLRGDILIYLLSGMFPRQHQINAGDWMTIIEEHGLRLKLVTVRGGFELIGTKEDFYQRMVQHTEPSQSVIGLMIHPFEGLEWKEFYRIYNQAKVLIKQ